MTYVGNASGRRISKIPVGVAGVAAVAGADRPIAAHGALRVGPARVRRAGVKPLSRNMVSLCSEYKLMILQGDPSALGKRYVDTKFEVVFSCRFILKPKPVTEL